ncbi:MAG: branched-chain amino acid ABC transporter permease [Limnobacter sp.]|uniref:branched-chain amino acid ABC transporter permease n=1 Tax=unclassified Limnobacter TaxID=2630203 RepID=UPI000C604328|nr:branched-chain amino acid ABC transporter permease [Limnobacter sp. UBA7229]MAG81345.1 branched-chain amino acid ABC transporter permease [Sutterellaceae bacterium]MBT83900.1 branched-chain amino acid ABC transporter permease [Sutterellaceae bacterium]
MDFISFFIQLLNAVQYSLVLFLVASGLTLVFGIMGVINLAHGSFYMIGAYLAFVLTGTFDSLLIAIAIGLPLAFVFGALLEKLLITHLYKRDHLEQVLLTYGLILIFEEIRSLLVGNDVHGVPVPEWLTGSIPLGDVQTYPVYRLAISAVCIILAIGLYFLIQRTRLGMMIRAGNHDRVMVQALGININRIYMFVFALGVSLAVLSGMLSAPVSSVFPNMGSHVLIISFVVVVIGGIGSVWGALLASLVIGFTDTFGKVFLPEISGMLVYLVMAAVLLWRPEGLFNRS